MEALAFLNVLWLCGADLSDMQFVFSVVLALFCAQFVVYVISAGFGVHSALGMMYVVSGVFISDVIF